MKNKLIFISILFQILTIGLNAQEFYKVNNGFVIVQGQEIKSLSFAFDSDYDMFLKKLTNDFGQPDTIKRKIVWKGIRKFSWSFFKIDLSVQINNINGIERDWKTVFITAVDSYNRDLLKPGSKSYEKIKKYLEESIANSFIDVKKQPTKQVQNQ